jgi:sarcosine reductase
MSLEVGSFPVDDIKFGPETKWEAGVLEVNRDEVMALLTQDPLIRSGEIDVARPGESTRVINYADLIEPKVKVSGAGVAYPGICGRSSEKTGEGRTHRLSNFAVVESIDYSGVPDSVRYASAQKQTGAPDPFFDKGGTHAVTPFASQVNLCLAMSPPTDLSAADHHTVIHSATMRVVDLLAATVATLDPPEMETFDLTPRDGLPGAVFIPHLSSLEWQTSSRSSVGMSVYGQTRLSAPWLLEGTEMLDGAVSQRHSLLLANNPVVLEMARRHGTSFNFVGCIIQRTNWTMQAEKEMAAERAAHLAQKIGAKAAIVTTDIRGQRYLETILTLQACERLGIATILLSEEEDPEGGTAPPFILSPPEMISAVSTGTGAVPGNFPTVEKVVGTVGKAAKHWYGEQPPIAGRYGAYHAQDIWGYGKQSLADY